MTVADIPFAIKATSLEGWGYTAADFKRMLRLDPHGCLKAVAEGKRVGITTAASYGEVGWIGNVIVLPRFRGHNIGFWLVDAAIEYLETKGAETVHLNSYFHTVDFYKGLGFRGEFENVRFHGTLATGTPPEEAASAVSLADVVRFDERYFGASRRRLLSSLKREFPNTFISRGSVGLDGFLVGQVSGTSCEVAPWVCDPRHPAAVKEMWRELSNRLPRFEVAFTAPSVSSMAMSFAKRAGMTAGFRTLRMYQGRKAHGGRPVGILGLGGLEKG